MHGIAHLNLEASLWRLPRSCGRSLPRPRTRLCVVFVRLSPSPRRQGLRALPLRSDEALPAGGVEACVEEDVYLHGLSYAVEDPAVAGVEIARGPVLDWVAISI